MDAPGGAPGTGAGSAPDDEAPAWTTVVAPGGAPVDPRTGPSRRRVVAWVVVVALIVIVAVSVAASFAARVLAEAGAYKPSKCSSLRVSVKRRGRCRAAPTLRFKAESKAG